MTYLKREWKNVQDSPYERYDLAQTPSPINNNAPAVFVETTKAPTNLNKISSIHEQHLNTNRNGEIDTSVYGPKYNMCVKSDGAQQGNGPKVENHPDTSAKDQCEYENKSSEICGDSQSQPSTGLGGSRAESTPPNMSMEPSPASKPGMDAPNMKPLSSSEDDEGILGATNEEPPSFELFPTPSTDISSKDEQDGRGGQQICTHALPNRLESAETAKSADNNKPTNNSDTTNPAIDRFATVLKASSSGLQAPFSVFPIISATSLGLSVNLLIDPCNEVTLVSKDLVEAIGANEEHGPKVQIEGVNSLEGERSETYANIPITLKEKRRC